MTDPIKSLTDRTRPNGAKGSFPSWHATRAAAYAGMGSRNLSAIEVNPAFRYSTQFLFTSLVAGTAWARIEAGQHYPTDVLFGAALGNFISIFFHDAFLGHDEKNDISLRTDMKEEIILLFEIRF
jgi:membrane-associated phospholipid phosphatase